MKKALHFYSRLFFAAITLLGLCHKAKAQSASDYIFLSSAGTYSPLAGGTVIFGGNQDEVLSPEINIGFNFVYNASSYSTFKASDNGFISLGSANTSSGYNNDLATTGITKPVLAPLWDDHATAATGSIEYLLSGSAPTRILTVQYKNMKWNWMSSSSQNFQIKIYETTNIIEFIYGSMTTPSNGSASIGINDENGGAGNYISITPGSPATFSSTSSNNNISTLTGLSSGLIYRFVPPTVSCPRPQNIVATNIISDEAQINWTESGTALEWELEYDTLGFIPTGTPTTIGIMSKPFTLTGLDAHKSYSVYARSVCGPNDTSAWKGPYSFRTTCAPVSSFPFTENFDAAFIPYLPGCYDKLISATGSSINVSTTYAHSGSQSAALYLSASTNGDVILVAPAVDQVDNKQLKFWARASSGTTNTLLIGVMDNALDASTFQYIQSVTVGDVWKQFTVYLSTYTGGGKSIAIKHGEVNTTTTLFVDDISIEMMPSCPNPTNMSASTITSSSLDLSWTENGIATEWDIEYGIEPFIPTGSPTIAGAMTNPFNVSGLNSNASYAFFVRSVCGAGDTSAWEGPFTVTTDCDAMTSYPSTETFDALTTPNLPNCWNYLIEAVAGDVYTTSSQSHSTNKSVLLENSFATSGSIILVSAALDSLSDKMVQFWARGGSAATTLVVGSMTDPVDSGTFSAVSVINMPIPSVWNFYTIYMGSGVGADKYIAFKHGLGGTYKNIYLDDITFSYSPSCIPPTNLTASNISESSADLGWTENGTSSAWDIEYGISGFAPTGVPSEGGVMSNPFTINTLTASTEYSFYVRSICGAGDTSSWSGPFTFSTICGAITVYPYIQDFENGGDLPICWSAYNSGTGTYNWEALTTDAAHGPASGHGGSGYFMSIDNYWADVDDNPYFLVSPKIVIPSPTAELSFYAWLGEDFNFGTYPQPFIVEVSSDNELTWTEIISLTSSDSLSTWFNVAVPLGGFNGDTIIVRFKTLSDYGTSLDNFGLDDFVIHDGATCPKPTALAVTNVTPISLDFGWLENGSASSWDIAFGQAPFTFNGLPTDADIIANPYHFNGLLPATAYTAYVRSICGGGDTSVWSGPFTCTTACDTLSVYPYEQNFDGLTTPAIPTCWTALINSSTSYTSVETVDYESHSPDNSLLLESYDNTTDGIIAVTPLMDSIHGKQLEFWATSDAGAVLEIGTIADPTDTAGFNLVQSLTLTSNFALYTVMFDAIVGTDRYMAFRHGMQSVYQSIYIDDVVIMPIPTCPRPIDLVVSNPATTSVDLGWTETGSATEWQLDVMPVTSVPTGNPTETGISTNPFTYNGLIASTNYKFYVRSVCGPGDTSYWSGPFVFATACDLVTIYPYTQNFDAVTIPDLPICWSSLVNSVSSSSYASTSTSNNHSAPNALEFYNSYDNAGAIMAVSPILDTIGDKQLDFWARATAGSVIHIGTIPGPTDTNGFSLIQSVSLTSTYTEYSVLFSSYAGSDQYIAFKHGLGGTYRTINVDDVTIGYIPTCPKPQQLADTNITQNTVDIAWLEMGTATAWQIAVILDTVTFNGMPTDTGVAINPWTVSGLSASTTYEFYVRSVCGPGDTSVWAGPVSFSTLCDVFSTFPMAENFNHAGDLPACWSVAHTGSSSYDWQSGTSDVAHGATSGQGGSGYFMFLNSYNAQTANNPFYLYTPPFGLPIGDIELSYYTWIGGGYDFTGTGDPFPISVEITNDNGANWTLIAQHGDTATGQWNQQLVDINAYAGDTVIIRFVGMSDYGYNVCNFGIDEFAINVTTVETDILSFQIPTQVVSQINNVAHTVSVLMPAATPSLNALVPVFTVSSGAYAKIGAIEQISGATANNFASPVVYRVFGLDSVTYQDWTVTVTKEIPNGTDFLSFSVPNQIGLTAIDNFSHRVDVWVPVGTYVNNLIATFLLSTGASAKVGAIPQVSGTTSNDFSLSAVTYSITAQDNITTQNYEVWVNIPVAISEEKAVKPEFTLYPNPNNGIFNLRFNKPMEAAVIEVMNLQGKSMYSEKLENISGQGVHAIDLTSLPKGVYIVRMHSEKISVVKRLVIQ